jgi:hypothetical protein
MSSRRPVAVAVVLGLLMLGAIGAANASAAGLTAVKCVNVGAGAGLYNNSHCETPEAVGAFETVALPLNETTEIEGEAIGTPTVQAVIAGVKLTNKCGTADSEGGFKNVTEGEEMRIHGTLSELTFTECKAALASNPARLCDVEGVNPATGKGSVGTRPLTGFSGPEHKVTLQPVEGEIFTEFKILTTGTECFFKTPVLVKVTGSVVATANTEKHSHVTFTGTNGGNLKANGSVVTMEATITGWMKGEPETTVGAKTF